MVDVNSVSVVAAYSACLVAAAAASIYILRRLQYLGKNEQLLVKKLTDKVVINGPAVYFPSLFTTLSYKKRQAISLTTVEYVVIRNEASGEVKVVRGPDMYFLGPHESAGDGPKKAVVLKGTQGLHVSDHITGKVSLVKGPATYVPGPHDVIDRQVEAVALQKTQYVRLEDTNTGEVWCQRGEKLLFLEPTWRQVGSVQTAYNLNSNQYIHLEDSLTGKLKSWRGEHLVFPGPFELPHQGIGVRTAVDLKAWEYTTVQDAATGLIRVEIGPMMVWLSPTERFTHGEKQAAVAVDAEHAVLVRNRHTGVHTLVEDPQLFFPAKDEEVVEVRELVRLADNEAIVLKDEVGSYHFFYGDPARGTKRAFFLPPYWEKVTLQWSRGRRRERRDLAITVFDTRPQYMSFEFNCRTSDNVEMILEGTFFWEVVSLPDMLKYSGDAPGDVCSHARSCFIQLISKVTLQEFMATFNDIAYSAHSNDDSFYSNRGIKIHSLEVTRYQCADHSTAMILEQIITETTNRMNRLSCQESENEVALAKLKGAVEQEHANTEFLAIQQQHALESARAEGQAEAERCIAFLNAVKEKVGPDGTSTPQQLAEQLWHALRKAEALKDVSTGNAHVYFTPQDANLTIEQKASR